MSHLAPLLALAGFSLLIPSVVVLSLHPEWRAGEE